MDDVVGHAAGQRTDGISMFDSSEGIGNAIVDEQIAFHLQQFTAQGPRVRADVPRRIDEHGVPHSIVRGVDAVPNRERRKMTVVSMIEPRDRTGGSLDVPGLQLLGMDEVSGRELNLPGWSRSEPGA